jgi:hypothetical protein
MQILSYLKFNTTHIHLYNTIKFKKDYNQYTLSNQHII